MERLVVLLAERDGPTRASIARGLRQEGHELVEAAHPLWYPPCPEDTNVWLGVVEAGGPFGYEPISEARRRGADHVLALVNPGGDFDLAGALDFGADDGVVKPCEAEEVLARVRAARRRLPRASTFEIGDLAVEPARRGVTIGDTPVSLTRREFDVLERLVRASARVVRRGELLDALWGYRGPSADASLSEHVRRLRAKLRTAGGGELIATVRGIGYRIDAEPPQ